MQINQRMKDVRQALNLSQAKFAKEISISNGYIAGLELGNRKMNDRLVKLICAQFDVNEHWLLTGDGDMFNKSLDKNLNKANESFLELSPVYREYVLKQIDDIIEMQKQTKES